MIRPPSGRSTTRRPVGVTTIAAEGNGFTDLGKPVFDDSSPDYPSTRTRSSQATTAHDRQLVQLDADRGRRRHRRHVRRPVEAEGLLLRLRRGAGRRRRTRRRHARHPRPTARAGSRTRSSPPIRTRSASAGPSSSTAARHRSRPGEPTSPSVIKQVGAYYQWSRAPRWPRRRRRRRRADRRRVRAPRPAGRRSDPAARPRRADPEAHGHRLACPRAGSVRVPGPARGLHGHARGRAGVQRVLRRGHRRRARRRAAGPRRSLVAHPPQLP